MSWGEGRGWVLILMLGDMFLFGGWRKGVGSCGVEIKRRERDWELQEIVHGSFEGGRFYCVFGEYCFFLKGLRLVGLWVGRFRDVGTQSTWSCEGI